MKNADIADCSKKPIRKLIKTKEINCQIIDEKPSGKLIDGLKRIGYSSQY